jgi:hypothetical protein
MATRAPKTGRPGSRYWGRSRPLQGLDQQHPNNYKDILNSLWENRNSLGYAWRILKDRCCDGCALGTTGMRDWTMKGVHLCALRLQLLRLNTKAKVVNSVIPVVSQNASRGQPLCSRANSRSRCYDFFQHA